MTAATKGAGSPAPVGIDGPPICAMSLLSISLVNLAGLGRLSEAEPCLPMHGVERSRQQLAISSSTRQNGDSERREAAKNGGNRQLAKAAGRQSREKVSRRYSCDEGRDRQDERTVPWDEVHPTPQERRGQAVGGEDGKSGRSCRSDRPQAGDQRHTSNHAYNKSKERVPSQYPGKAQGEDREGIEA